MCKGVLQYKRNEQAIQQGKESSDEVPCYVKMQGKRRQLVICPFTNYETLHVVGGDAYHTTEHSTKKCGITKSSSKTGKTIVRKYPNLRNYDSKLLTEKYLLFKPGWKE